MSRWITNTRVLGFFLTILSCSMGNLSSSQASIGNVGFVSSSFLYQSPDRGTSSTWFRANLAGATENQWLVARGDLDLFTFVDNQPAFSAESKEAYIATQPGLIGNHQIAVGRKIVDWSRVDQSWNMISLWSPRFNWDPLNQELIGLTGAFYFFQSPEFEFTAYGSPIAIPERGTPIQEKNGSITSPNPFWQPLQTQAQVLGQDTKINYSLITPSLENILLRPNAAIRAKFKGRGGLWASANAGILAVHSTPLAAEPFVNTPDQGNLQVNIRPQFPMRNIYTAEAGFDSLDKDWSTWVSASYETPFQYENNRRWLNPVITPATVVSAGAETKITSNFIFRGSVIVVREESFEVASDLPDVDIQLPSRFPLKQGFLMGGDWIFSDRTRSHFRWIQDLQQQNHLVSADISYQFPKSSVLIGAGADIVVASSGTGWVGQYFGDDRVRGWLRYAF